MDYKDLQAFLAISTTLHLGQAARQLNMSASTLSRRLARMEEEAGARLLDRDSTPLQLTHAGMLFRQHAEQNIASFQQLCSAVSTQVSDFSGSLTLFCTVTDSYRFLVHFLPPVRDCYHNVYRHSPTA